MITFLKIKVNLIIGLNSNQVIKNELNKLVIIISVLIRENKENKYLFVNIM